MVFTMNWILNKFQSSFYEKFKGLLELPAYGRVACLLVKKTRF